MTDDYEPSPSADRIARAEMARALAHPRLVALRPVLNGTLAVTLGAYTLVYLLTIFSLILR